MATSDRWSVTLFTRGEMREMNATERARRSDSLYYDTTTTNRRALCDMIANLESDLEESKARNAKLQKLVYDLLNAWDDMQHEVITGPTFDECERYAYELGIEVN
jgi:hypothetical protein